MRRIATVVICGSLATSVTQAQITVSPDNMPVPGTVVVYQVDTLASSSLWTTPSSVAQNWDFSAIANHLRDTVEIYDPASTGFGSDFPDAYYAIPQGFAFAEVFVFFRRDTIAGTVIDSSIGVAGYLDIQPFFSGYISEQALDGEQFIYAPITYNDYLTTDGHYLINISDGVGIDTIVHVFTERRDSVDAFGTVITPAGTFDVIRLSGYQVFRMVVEVTGFGSFPVLADTVYRQTFLTDSAGYTMPIAMLEMRIVNQDTFYTARALANYNNVKPVAFFVATDTDVVVGEPIVFVNSSSGATSFKWYFGDGDSSTISTPQKVYNAPGQYTVTLIASNGFASDTLTRVNYIEVWNVPVADFIYSPDTPKAQVDTVRFTNLSTNATSYLWNFGDGTTSTDTNPSHVYPLGGTYRVRLFASNPGGTDSVEKAIVVASVNSVVTIDGYGIELYRTTPDKLLIKNVKSNGLRFNIKVYLMDGKELASITLVGRDQVVVSVPEEPVVVVISEGEELIEKMVR